MTWINQIIQERCENYIETVSEGGQRNQDIKLERERERER